MTLTTWISLAGLVLVFSLNGVYGSNVESRLSNTLFAMYDKRVIPLINSTTEILNSQMGIMLSNIKHVDLNNNKAVLTVWIKMQWSDYRLQWDPEDHGGITMMRINMEDIWIPDITLFNGKEVPSFKPKGLLYNNGQVYYLPPYEVEVAFKHNAAWFPHDKHTILLKYGSWTYDGSILDVQPSRDSVDMEDYWENTIWDITGTSAVRHAVKYPCCEEVYIDVMFQIKIARKASFLHVSLLAPSILTSICLVFVFALPPVCREKMTLAIAILLGMLLFNYMHFTIVSVSTILSDFLLFGLVLTVLVIGEISLVYNLFHRFGEVPNFIRKLFVDWLARLLCISPPPPSGSCDVEMKQNANADEKSSEADRGKQVQSNNQDWMIIAKVVDRIGFCIFVLTYVVGSAVLLSRRD